MSLNGVSSYSYNPYAYNNAYSTNATSFQGYNTTSATSTSEKEGSSLGTLALIGTGIAAVGTAIYSIKKGKKINIAGLGENVVKNSDDFKGLKGIWKNLTTGVKSIFTKAGREVSSTVKQNEAITELLGQLGEDSSKLDSNKLASVIEQQVRKANPEATADDIKKVVNQYIKQNGDDTIIITNNLEDLLKGYQKANTKAVKNYFTTSAASNTAKNVAKNADNAKTLTEKMENLNADLEKVRAERKSYIEECRAKGMSIPEIKNDSKYTELNEQYNKLKSQHSAATIERANNNTKANNVLEEMKATLEKTTDENEKARIQNNIEQFEKCLANA